MWFQHFDRFDENQMVVSFGRTNRIHIFHSCIVWIAIRKSQLSKIVLELIRVLRLTRNA